MLNAEPTQSEFKAQFSFDSGSYGDVGKFMPSIACKKQTQNGSWEYHFILVKRNAFFADEDQAAEEVEKDISDSFEINDGKGSGSDVALKLKNIGYVSVDNFNIVGGA